MLVGEGRSTKAPLAIFKSGAQPPDDADREEAEHDDEHPVGRVAEL